MEKKLHKSDTDKKLGGVCAGIAETLDTDISVVRIAAFFLCVLYPVMLIVYFLLAIFLPSPKDSAKTSNQSEAVSSEESEESHGSFALWAFVSVLFCIIFGCAVSKRFALADGIDSVIIFTVLSTGLYIFFSGICEPNSNESSKITKTSIGAVISVMCISKALDKFAFNFLPFNYLAISAFYFWPLIIAAFGVTIIISNKKIATAVWVAIFILIVIFSVVSGLNATLAVLAH